MRELYIVTHTEAQHHVDQLVGGWYDSSLTKRGLRQADAVAERLDELLEAAPRIITSDLARTRETAERIAARFGTPVDQSSDLREMSQGVAEGRHQAWLDERFVPAPEENRLDFRSVEGSETKREFITRIYRAVDAILEDPAPAQIVVTHGFAMTFVVASWVRMPLESASHINVRATSGGISRLVEDDFFRNRQIHTLNEVAHLEGI